MALGGGFGDGWSLLGWRGFAGVGNIVQAMVLTSQQIQIAQRQSLWHTHVPGY